jgi:hypothetical protein
MNPSGVRLAPNASGVGFGAGEGTIVFLGRSKVPSGLGGSTGSTGTSPVGGGKGSGTTGSTTGTTGAGATKNATVSPFGLGNLLSK